MTMGQSLFFTYISLCSLFFHVFLFYFKWDFFCDEQWSMVLFCTFFLFFVPPKKRKGFYCSNKTFIWWYAMGGELDIVWPNVSAKRNGLKILMELLCNSFFFLLSGPFFLKRIVTQAWFVKLSFPSRSSLEDSLPSHLGRVCQDGAAHHEFLTKKAARSVWHYKCFDALNSVDWISREGPVLISVNNYKCVLI